MSEKKKPDAWMPLYGKAYLSATTHLSAEQHGAYILLLLHGWSHGGRLPAGDAQLFQITRMTPKQWKDSRPVLLEFFDKDATGYTQKRQVEELTKAEKMVNAKSEAGTKGAKARWQNDDNAMASAMADGIAEHMADTMADTMAKRCQDDAPLPITTPSPKARSRASNPTREAPPAFALPDWVAPESWGKWRQHRGKKLTPPAVKLQLGKLDQLRQEGYDPSAMIDLAIESGWATFYAPRNGHAKRGNGRLSAAGEQTAEAGKRWIEEQEAIDAANNRP